MELLNDVSGTKVIFYELEFRVRGRIEVWVICFGIIVTLVLFGFAGQDERSIRGVQFISVLIEESE